MNPQLGYTFILAERLRMTVTELNDRMPLEEFFAWQQFDEWRADEQLRRENDAEQERERMERVEQMRAEAG